MKKLIILFFMFLLTQASYAQSDKGCDRAGKLAEKLDLEENQVEAVQQILNEQHKKKRDLFQASRDSLKQKMDDLHLETKDKLGSVLNPDQMARFEELHAKRVEKIEQRRKKRMQRFKETAKDTDRKLIGRESG